MSIESNVAELKSVKVTDLTNKEPFSLMDVLTERERIALTSRWAALKDSERDEYAEFEALHIDSATLYAIRTLKQDASTKIFSDNRASYILLMLSNYMTLQSKEDLLKRHAQSQLEPLKELRGAQLMTLLSAVKERLLDKRTFMPEAMENGFTALCQYFNIAKGLVK